MSGDLSDCWVGCVGVVVVTGGCAGVVTGGCAGGSLSYCCTDALGLTSIHCSHTITSSIMYALDS